MIFQYTTNARLRKGIKKTTPFIHHKNIKFLPNFSLKKCRITQYTENNKTFLRDHFKYLHNKENIPCSWIGRFNIVNMLILPKSTYRVNTIQVKILAEHVCACECVCVCTDRLTNSKLWQIYKIFKIYSDNRQILKLTWKCKRPRIVMTLLKKSKAGGFLALGIKTA